MPSSYGAKFRCSSVSGGYSLMRWANLAVVATLALSACATPARMHSDEQLNTVALGCGLALGELLQDDSEKRLLLLIHQDPSASQRLCVAKWARKNGLKAVFVNMQFPAG